MAAYLDVMDTSNFAITLRLTAGVSIEPPSNEDRRAILKSVNMDAASPITYGYGDNLPIYCDNGPILIFQTLP